MIPLTFLYGEYIDRPKLSEQKNPFEYIVPPPTSGVRTTRRLVKVRRREIFMKQSAESKL